MTPLFQNITDSNYFFQPSWVVLIIILSLMLIGYLYSAFHTRFMTFIKAVFISRYSVQASREERSLSHPVSLLLSLNFLLTASLFILQLFSSGAFFRNKIEFSFLSFFLIIILILTIYVIKIAFLRMLSFILDKREIISEYIFTIFLVTHFLGILLIPIVISIAYGPKTFIQEIIFVGACLFAATFFIRIGKGIASVLERQSTTVFYLILYLCTLEIMPLLVGIKLFEKLA